MKREHTVLLTAIIVLAILAGIVLNSRETFALELVDRTDKKQMDAAWMNKKFADFNQMSRQTAVVHEPGMGRRVNFHTAQ